MGFLVLRLGQIMFFQAETLEELAENQWTKEITVSAVRGSILDRNGEVLAQSKSAKSVVLNPSDIDDPDEMSQILSKILDMDYEAIYEKAVDKSKSEIWLKRQITDEIEQEIIDAGLTSKGVSFFVESQRYYPYGAFLSQVIGYTNVDGDGQEGLEKKFDKYLSGYDGSVLALVDAHGNTISGSEEVYIEPQNGYNAVLTVDAVIQSFAENAAKEACEVNNAAAATIIVMDPDTSDVLAMANYPQSDLNNLPRDDIALLNSLARNRAVTDAYEPGSTFKVITTAAALDSGTIGTDYSYTCTGFYTVNGENIKCWRSGNPHGLQTLPEVLQNSCNPAFMNMAMKMGKELFYDYLSKFGFGSNTGIDYSSDGAGILIGEQYVTDSNLARIGFGQSIAVTPLQLANAVCSVINGGTRNTPSLVSHFEDENGNVAISYDGEQGTQILSENTSALMREMLESVVEEGSGSNAKIEGYSVGGKTGTAQMYGEDGSVKQGSVIPSFICFAPVDDPQFLVLTIVYEPQVAVTYGSVVAAPFAAQVMEQCLKYKGVKQDKEIADPGTVVVPNIVGQTAQEAARILEESELNFDGNLEGSVALQSPSAGITVKKGSTVAAVMVSEELAQNPGISSVVTPDVVGKSVSEAYEILKDAGLTMKLDGEERGKTEVATQTPAAGEPCESGVVTVTLKEETQQAE